jgi:hypothetical protein
MYFEHATHLVALINRSLVYHDQDPRFFPLLRHGECGGSFLANSRECGDIRREELRVGSGC